MINMMKHSYFLFMYIAIKYYIFFVKLETHTNKLRHCTHFKNCQFHFAIVGLRLLLLKHWDQGIGILNILHSNKNLHAGDNNLHHPNCIQRCWFDHHTTHHHSNRENCKHLGMGLLLLGEMQLLYHQYWGQGIHIY